MTVEPGAFATITLFIHIGCGAAGLVSGAVAMFTRKGARWHRLAGKVFFIVMLVMAASGAIVAQTQDVARWTNTAAALFTLYLVITAWTTVRRPAGVVGRLERYAMAAPIGIVGMALILATGAPPVGEDPTPVYVFAVISALAVIADIWMIRRGGVFGVNRIARHLWRMSAALLVATAAFFFGQADTLPQTLRATGLPTALALAPLVLMGFWLVRVRLPRRPPSVSAPHA